MKAKLLSYCKAESLFSPGQTVICAVSGGADSMALLRLLHSAEQELGIKVEAAHFNHKLRGEESEKDEGFVKAFCEARSIPLHIGSEDVHAYGKLHQLGTEEAARQCRYRFFHSLHSTVATAHNAEDNLETVLMHLLRGSGLRGLCGIPPKRGNIVRPLLWATREEILAYLAKEGLTYREDSSNRSLCYTRNRLRHQVLPLLREENPKIAQRVLKQSTLLRQEDSFLDTRARELLHRDATGAFALAPLLTAPDPLQKRALRLMVGHYLQQDVSLSHIEALQELLSNPCPSARVSLPLGLVACRRYDSLYFRKESLSSFPEMPLQIPGETQIPGLPWKIFCKIEKIFIKMTNTPFHFAIKYDMISGCKISLRPRQTGDRLQTADGHSKTLKKLMIEKKIPQEERGLLPVLTDGTRVLAVGGLGISHCCSPVEGQSALIVYIEKGEFQ